MSESSSLPLFGPLVDPGPSFADVLTASGLAITGYVDVSYQHLNGEGYFAYNGGADRVFDWMADFWRKEADTVNEIVIRQRQITP